MDNRDTNNESAGKQKARGVAAKLDEATETFAGTSNVDPHAKVGYTEQNVEERAQSTAEEEGVTLHRNPDGSHTAVDESKVAEATSNSENSVPGDADQNPADRDRTGGTPSGATASDDTEGGHAPRRGGKK